MIGPFDGLGETSGVGWLPANAQAVQLTHMGERNEPGTIESLFKWLGGETPRGTFTRSLASGAVLPALAQMFGYAMGPAGTAMSVATPILLSMLGQSVGSKYLGRRGGGGSGWLSRMGGWMDSPYSRWNR